MATKNDKPLSGDEKFDWLRLIRSDNVGPITFYRLLERFGTAAAALDALPELAKRGGGKKKIKTASRAQAETEMQSLKNINADLVGWGEPGYPPLLNHIEDAPPLLSVLGHAHLLTKKAVAVVGARNASINGRKFARRMAEDLGKGGLLVVSGLARGIDADAHAGALDTGTIGVLAGGVDIVYPRENQALYDELCDRGALVSEIAPGTKPQARHFPRRNRIISGIARGTVVIEAGDRSGSLITARMALEQGRDVFAVPGAPGDPRSAGGNRLIRSGAILVESAENVFEAFQDAYRPSLEEQERIDFKAKIPPPPSDDEVEKARLPIKESLGVEPVTVDEIIRNCQVSLPIVSMVLLEMELAGCLERHPGNKVSVILS
ncbi:MAG: DNA-protecting protein DprA [Rhodospirillaceae bacterium]|nr:DNA-protecting protein DprA [Rhodospirillaceae bacterium]MBT5013946.1 DNA-protecting protein DprA [Rhodospirillaceae bacterium]MBT5309422.1 DNA-protecting protein DprA [Rhodospirillaceae bacterium]MBT6406851.1 DNA-protecting protein DprA [Rhodospirillaceae bacterium]MBT7355917.1 DNA-protecting protein DprA [Rhodospirillaceae bacterium]